MILSFVCFDLAFTSEKKYFLYFKVLLEFISFLGNSIFHFWIMIFICLAFFIMLSFLWGYFSVLSSFISLYGSWT